MNSATQLHKHVFVETNFLIDLLRPMQSQSVNDLFVRHGQDLYLYIPWCCQSEAARTLDRIIDDDFSFIKNMMTFSQKLHLPSNPQGMKPFHDLKRWVEPQQRQAKKDYLNNIRETCQKISIIEPMPNVINKTLTIFQKKLLAPFDEMILGAVLAHAAYLRQLDSNAIIYFATLNKRDFGTESLLREYASVGIQYIEKFDIP
jgi:hypothetical protein